MYCHLIHSSLGPRRIRYHTQRDIDEISRKHGKQLNKTLKSYGLSSQVWDKAGDKIKGATDRVPNTFHILQSPGIFQPPGDLGTTNYLHFIGPAEFINKLITGCSKKNGPPVLF